jgi:hypothetical protein
MAAVNPRRSDFPFDEFCMWPSKGKPCSSDAVRDVRGGIMMKAHHEQHARVVERGADRWSIREVDTDRLPGASGPRCLICESDDVVRRIWHYPENWLSLSDDELLSLCGSSVT